MCAERGVVVVWYLMRKVSLVNKLRVVDELQMFKIHLIDPSLSKFLGISGVRAVRDVLAALSLAAAYATFTHQHCVRYNPTLAAILLSQCALTSSYVHNNEYSDN